MTFVYSRRRWLQQASLGAAAALLAPRMVFARAQTDRRFIFIIQRGAADGLNTVIPYADPAYASLRRELAIAADSATKLDGTFALHASLASTAGLYQSGEALFVHAVASPYRERSHFDGQNVLETGGSRPYQRKDGWLNRLLGLLPKQDAEAVALAPTVPLALRGQGRVASYAPSALPPPPDDLLLRVEALYESDTQLHKLWTAAMQARDMAGETKARQNPAELGKLAATFLARPDGPRVAMIETGGWDTHAGQNARLAAQLKNLDTLIAALKEHLGAAWNQTVILVATEFGRTAAANGTGGTDHGTGSAAMLIGGAVQGGRIIADWPGLDKANLREARDLRPTLGLHTLIAHAAAECYGLEAQQASRTLFPGIAAEDRLPRLLKA
ncbi:MAG: DUF1501 domain-containing protein [Pigmentiphaga sp.]|uniref:DUF1501 domain-containing protein n=1 Tax=Pigmentiphaga sp. TaxID=1977564 RepID=UPI0029A2E31A|nr:DUF1501 domain-containing protein [Pigmentiphaga sp.]MDX3907390.1 DUF1501 domain-containing protein [Pigmentiphaga sp.]